MKENHAFKPQPAEYCIVSGDNEYLASVLLCRRSAYSCKVVVEWSLSAGNAAPFCTRAAAQAVIDTMLIHRPGMALRVSVVPSMPATRTEVL